MRETQIKKKKRVCCSYLELLEPVDYWCFMKNNIGIISHTNFVFCGVWTARGRLLNVHRNSGRSVTSSLKLYSVSLRWQIECDVL